MVLFRPARCAPLIAALAVAAPVAIAVPAGSAAAAPRVAAAPARASVTSATAAKAVSRFTKRVALGTTTPVAVGSVGWARDTVSKGGRRVTLAAPSGPAHVLLSHGKAAASSITFALPAPGVYRLVVVLPLGATTPTGTLYVGGRPVLPSIALASHPQYVAVTVAATRKKLTARLSGGLPISGVQVAGLRALPADPSLVPLVPVIGALPASGVPPRTQPARPRWTSGAWPGATSDTAADLGFGRYRHRTLDVVSLTNPQRTWDDIANDMSGVQAQAGYPGRLSIALAMLPYDRSSTLADVIDGSHDADFTSFAAGLVRNGRADAIVRVGWEFNGDWQPWAAFNPTQFIAAFRRIVTDLRAADPKVVIDWNGNFGYSQVKLDPFTKLYPGDSYVDIVGVDAYDRKYYHVHDEASWESYLNGVGGLNSWYSFAMKHHKRFSVPEWALYNEEGDNPYYIQKMHSFFAAHAKNIAYECYFSYSAGFIESDIYPAAHNHNPKSSVMYAALWG